MSIGQVEQRSLVVRNQFQGGPVIGYRLVVRPLDFQQTAELIVILRTDVLKIGAGLQFRFSGVRIARMPVRRRLFETDRQRLGPAALRS